MANIFVFCYTELACGADENIHEIPWEKLIGNPHQYFDTSLYKLPYALNAPEVLKSKPLHIVALHDLFINVTSVSIPLQGRNHEVLRAGKMN